MPDESNFHITLVTQKRVPRRGGEGAQSPAEPEKPPLPETAAETPAKTERAAAPAPEHSGRGASSRRGKHSPHRRQYKDYGTVNLGVLDAPRSGREQEASEPEGPESAAPEISKGREQREFFDKYDAALSRHYTARNGGKLTRILLIGLLAVLVILAALLGVSTIRNQTGETLPAPQMETIPVVTLDLGK